MRYGGDPQSRAECSEFVVLDSGFAHFVRAPE
jgi:hypothetical protein